LTNKAKGLVERSVAYRLDKEELLGEVELTMVAGLKFLSKKSFNPQNKAQRERVYLAREEEKQEARRIKERQEQLQRERDDEELSKARGDAPKLNFMYKPPPGLEAPAEQRNKESKESRVAQKQSSADSLTERRPGDDDAAAAFRQMLATAGKIGETEDMPKEEAKQSSFGTVLQGTNVEANTRDSQQDSSKASLSALEKAVGRRQDGGAVTLDEMVERFPALANAPREKGVDASSSAVNFKPLGTQIRQIRCLACGIWGHSRGDRECEKSGWDPFRASQRPTLLSQQPDEKKSVAKDRTRSRDDSESELSDSSEESRRRERKRRKKHHHKLKRKHNRRESSKHRKRSRSRSPDPSRSRKKSQKRSRRDT